MLLFCSFFSGCTWFRNCVGKCPEKSHKLAEQARLAEEAGDIRQAVAFFEGALAETPDDPHLHRETARLLLKLDQRAEAQRHLQVAVDENPDDVEANVELAQLYIANHQAHFAVECLESALQSDPKHITALVLRGKLAEYLNDPQTAIETYHRVLGVEPNHVEARVRLAWLHLENRQPHLAAPLLRSVCQSSRAEPEQTAEARWALGIAYGQEDRWQDAVRSLISATEEGIEMTADDWHRLAYAKSRLGDWEGVRSDLEQTLKLDPQHKNAVAMRDLVRRQEQAPETPILRIGHSVKPIPAPEFW